MKPKLNGSFIKMGHKRTAVVIEGNQFFKSIGIQMIKTMTMDIISTTYLHNKIDLFHFSLIKIMIPDRLHI